MSSGPEEKKKKHSLEGFISSTVPLSLLASQSNEEGMDPETSEEQSILKPLTPPESSQILSDRSPQDGVQEDSVFDVDIDGMSHPLRPRGDIEQGDKFREKHLSSDSEVLSMHSVLMQLDKQAE